MSGSWKDKLLESLAIGQSEILDMDLDSERKQLYSRNRQKKNFHNINWLKDFKEMTITTSIFVLCRGERVAVEDMKRIECECIKENIKKFTQANNTPPSQETQNDCLNELYV